MESLLVAASMLTGGALTFVGVLLGASLMKVHLSDDKKEKTTDE